jgi:hypothetical protein
MKKMMWLGVLIGTMSFCWGQGFQPMSGGDNNDNTQPIGPISDDGSTGQVLSGPGIVTAAVPEPSSLSLLAGGGILSAWFFLRHRR